MAQTKFELPEKIIITKDLTGRKEKTEIESLAHDIYKNGQETPIKCRHNDQKQLVVVFGHRRLAAVDFINKNLKGPREPKFQIEYMLDKMTETEAIIAAIGENRFRKGTTAIDDAHNIQVLTKRFKMTPEQIAEIYFPEAIKPKEKSEAVRWVKTHSGLADMAEEAKEAVRDGRMKVTTAVHVARKSKDEQREIVAKGGTGLKGGEKRIKVSDVKKPSNKAAAATGTGTPAPAAEKAVPKAAWVPPVKPTGGIFQTAEELAQAIDRWIEDATEAAEKAVINAHKEYRKLVPRLAAAESKVAA